MPSNIDPKKLKLWLSRNGWDFSKKTKHELWIYKEGNLDKKRTLTINFHRNKGQGIAEDALKDIASIMKITKKELVEKIKTS